MQLRGRHDLPAVGLQQAFCGVGASFWGAVAAQLARGDVGRPEEQSIPCGACTPANGLS